MHWWLPEISPGEKILRSLIVYFFLLLMFRLLGKREVAQMTVFDLVVLLILSNVVQNAMIGPDNSVTGGLIGATTILVANWFVGRAAFGHPRFGRALEGTPTLVVHRGRFLEANMRHENISKEELMSNLRSQGVFNLKDVRTAIIEPSGKLSVMKDPDQPRQSPQQPETPR
ncbi:MAG TPA: YetF domain-containing protein [Candidatus Acidoferrales bacterium]|nr:YetF domain-containing protein [Candidatus Acidoferrales bacterium]